MKIKFCLMMLIVVLTMSVTAKGDLVAYWPFDSDIKESQGNTQFDGIAVGNAVVSSEDSAVGAGALKIDDDTGSANHVNIATSPFAGNEQAFSVVGWFKNKDISGDGSDSRAFILETDNYKVSYGTRPTAETVEIGEWYMLGTPGSSDTSGPVVDIDTWHHFVLTYDAVNGVLRHYIDGQLRDNVTDSPGVGLDATTYLNIGSHRAGDGGRNFDGYIDDIAVFSDILNIEQVAALYNKTHTPDTVGELKQLTAWGHQPADGAAHVAAGTALSWEAPADVDSPSYNVYLSTEPDMTSGNIELASGITETTADLPLSLDPATTYYWRVDTVDGENGDIVSFMSTEGLVAYWPFDTDPNMANTQGNSDFDGQQIGNATVSSEDFIRGDAALRIDDNRTTANLVHVPNSPVIGGQKVYTISAWYKFKDVSNNGFDDRNFIFENTTYSASFGIRVGGDPSVKRSQYVINTTSGLRANDAGDGPRVDDKEWHHAAIVFNSIDGTQIRYFHDGALMLSEDIENSLVLTDADIFNIGDYREGNGDRNWDGYIDDVAVFDVSLLPAQVNALYNGTRTPFNVMDELQLSAINPSPEVGAEIQPDSQVQLSWELPPDMVDPRFDVYLSTDPNMVLDVTALTTDLDGTNVALPGNLSYETAYYWRVDSTSAQGGDTYSSDIWSFNTSVEPVGLIAWWPFDEDTKNAQGNADLDGTLVGNAVITSEEMAEGTGALMIDDDPSSDGTLVDVASTVMLGIASERNTVVAWYQYSDIGGDGSDARNFVWETDTTWSLSFGVRSDIVEDTRIAEWYYNGENGSDRMEPVGSGPVTDPNTWYHVAMVYDVAENYVKYYHDGELIDQDTAGAGKLLTTPEGFHIGNHRAGDGGRNFDGYIDEVAVYDSALTAYQIKQLVSNPEVTCGNVLDVRKYWADFNNDGKVDIEDFSMFASKWLSDDSEYDADGDGVVNLGDFSLFADSWMP